VHPHPALKVSVPMNPMVDGWIGDDWFHNGAFRQQNMPYIYEQVATRANSAKWWTSHFDDYDMFMQAGSAGELGRRRGLEQIGFWQKLVEHPGYDAFWRDQAVDRILASQPLDVPLMLVHSLWDQEDIYGDIAVYKAIEPKDVSNDKVFLVIGPWHHGQEIEDGSSLGALKFGSDTGLYFRREILRPFLDHFLKDDAPRMEVSPVTAFETGTNAWRRLTAWPSGCASGCTPRPTPLYLKAGLGASFEAPTARDTAFDEYVADPVKPVPFRARPIQPVGYDNGLTWPQWLVDDQREASGRPDVVAFTSAALTAPVKISSQPLANLIASTSGTDADWVVKLIDVYPDEVAGQPAMGGYQLMVSADIFRGRYRESLEMAKAIAADTPLLYRFALPTANHVFLPGHRVMVQIQSSWFPLYDRNPQTFVRNIFFAQPDERAHDEKAHLHGAHGVQNRGGHNGAVLRERPRASWREFEVAKVVTVCDHLITLGLRQLKPEIGWEALDVALHRLIQDLRRHTVDGGEVRVEHDVVSAQDLNGPLDLLLQHQPILAPATFLHDTSLGRRRLDFKITDCDDDRRCDGSWKDPSLSMPVL
jgi:uncharacterized protein